MEEEPGTVGWVFVFCFGINVVEGVAEGGTLVVESEALAWNLDAEKSGSVCPSFCCLV